METDMDSRYRVARSYFMERGGRKWTYPGNGTIHKGMCQGPNPEKGDAGNLMQGKTPIG